MCMNDTLWLQGANVLQLQNSPRSLTLHSRAWQFIWFVCADVLFCFCQMQCCALQSNISPWSHLNKGQYPEVLLFAQMQTKATLPCYFLKGNRPSAEKPFKTNYTWSFLTALWWTLTFLDKNLVWHWGERAVTSSPAKILYASLRCIYSRVMWCWIIFPVVNNVVSA